MSNPPASANATDTVTIDKARQERRIAQRTDASNRRGAYFVPMAAPRRVSDAI
jgi:hypothetical protein